MILVELFRALKVCTPAQARLSLRKLHLRWWHAQAATMNRILRRADVPKPVCDLIPEIVHTCTSCRAWSRPLPASVASVELVDSISQRVECDWMFVFHYIIFHLIDRCTRWHAACLVPSKERSYSLGHIRHNLGKRTWSDERAYHGWGKQD